MAHSTRVRGVSRRSRRAGQGFTLIELMVVLAIASILMLIGVPALLNILAHYKVHSSAQQLVMLGRQARYESIKLNQPVTLVADSNRNSFYVYSGTLPGMPPYNLPDGPGDIPAVQRVAEWSVPRGVKFLIQPACTGYCGSFSFNPDGSATLPAGASVTGQSVVFSTPNQSTTTVLLKPAAALTGKLVITIP